MSKRLYVGNLPYTCAEDDLRSHFEEYGPLEDVVIIEGRGFGFVTVPDDQVQPAIDGLNGKELAGRALTINEARPRENRGGSRGGGYGGGGRDRRGGYGGGGGGGYGGGGRRRDW